MEVACFSPTITADSRTFTEPAIFTVKNTFLSVSTCESAPIRRCNSVPRAWKPGSADEPSSCAAGDDCFEECVSEGDAKECFEEFMSAADDTVSEDALSEQGAGEPSEKWSGGPSEKWSPRKAECSDETTDDSVGDASEDWPCDNWSFANTEDAFSVAGLDDAFEELLVDSDVPQATDESCGIASNADSTPGWMDAVTCVTCVQDSTQEDDRKAKVTLNLFDTVCPETTEQSENGSRSKLRSKAVPFASLTRPPAEVNSLIAGAAEALKNHPDIVEVKVRDGGMGGTTLIMAHSHKAFPDGASVFYSVKDSLLSLAERSENTYILGYRNNPFQTLDALSFSTNIARMPDSHQNSACWDMYAKGFCPRCGTCRWDHPSKTDTMQLIVTITKNVAA